MKLVGAAAVALLAVVVLVLSPMLDQPADAAGLNGAALPPAALDLLDDISAAGQDCPDIPLAWLVAQIEVESGFNPTAVSPEGAAGLLQLMPGTWVEVAGPGGPWPRSGPRVDHPVFDPPQHLPVAVALMCANLRAMTVHLAATDKPIGPLDAMAVCHVAGCSRVLASATGIPTPGEAECGAACVAEIVDYLARIRQLSAVYGATGPGDLLDGTQLPPPPAPYIGDATGCTRPDPTGTGGCLTAATRHGHAQILLAAGGGWRWGASCWDEHAWNPSSDHPRGRACDYTLGTIGAFPDQQLVAHGWVYAEWLRTHAGALRVRYIIWQGRIWHVSRASDGWTSYSGGGVYDPSDATGGHYDHIHVSWQV